MNKLVSFFLITSLSPIFIILILINLIDDGLPVIFKQKRIGKNNIPFFIFKFRTMKQSTLDIPTHLVKENQLFYTRVGPFLRKYSLDEFPQLFNILKGEMCFFGPRPSLYNQYDLINLRTELGIHEMRPGLTGWAQVNGRDELSIKKKIEMDYFYLNNKSVFLDIKILILTIFKVIKSEGIA